MSYRIGLFTQAKQKKKGQPSTTATYVDIADVAELNTKLTHLGAKRAGLMLRDRDGATHLAGEIVEPPKFGAKDFRWLADKPAEFETRGVFYD